MTLATKTYKEVEILSFFKFSTALAAALRGADPVALFEAHDELDVLAMRAKLPSVKARAARLVAQHRQRVIESLAAAAVDPANRAGAQDALNKLTHLHTVQSPSRY